MDKFKPKSKKFPEEVADSIARFQEVDFTLWDSPIQLIETVPRTTYEDGIFNAVKKVGVVVDKERLLMVLQNDRASYADGYRAGIEAAQPKWISVEDRLPNAGEKVIVCGVKNGMQVGAFSGLSHPEKTRMWWWKKNTILEVTHWMPLPSTEGIE